MTTISGETYSKIEDDKWVDNILRSNWKRQTANTVTLRRRNFDDLHRIGRVIYLHTEKISLSL